jgi:hypothetical protein
MVLIKAEITAMSTVLPKAIIISSLWNKRGYKSNVNPVHSPTLVASVKEKAIKTRTGRYINNKMTQM